MTDEEEFSLMRRGALQGSAAVAGLVALGAPAQAAGGIAVRIDAAKKSDPITRYHFGALIEHIAGGINYSLWSEVLEDRKFFGQWTIGRYRNRRG
jgi:alpha-N-arabinofuranosidase